MTLPVHTDGSTVLARVSRVMKTDAARLVADAPYWTGIADDAAVSGSGLVVRTLVSKGYTAAQLAADPQIQELCTRVGVCHALKEAAASGDFANLDGLKHYCECEKELADWPPIDDDLAAAEAPIASSGRNSSYDDTRERVRRVDRRDCYGCSD